MAGRCWAWARSLGLEAAGARPKRRHRSEGSPEGPTDSATSASDSRGSATCPGIALATTQLLIP
eukprot:11208353-Alexandrium_andersonii.AAC.1